MRGSKLPKVIYHGITRGAQEAGMKSLLEEDRSQLIGLEEENDAMEMIGSDDEEEAASLSVESGLALCPGHQRRRDYPRAQAHLRLRELLPSTPRFCVRIDRIAVLRPPPASP